MSKDWTKKELDIYVSGFRTAEMCCMLRLLGEDWGIDRLDPLWITMGEPECGDHILNVETMGYEAVQGFIETRLQDKRREEEL